MMKYCTKSWDVPAKIVSKNSCFLIFNGQLKHVQFYAVTSRCHALGKLPHDFPSSESACLEMLFKGASNFQGAVVRK